MVLSKFFREWNISKKIRKIKLKIREFFSYKGFNLIKFISVYSIVHVFFINCFNAMLFWDTLPVAPTVKFMASAVMMWPICYTYSDTFFNFCP